MECVAVYEIDDVQATPEGQAGMITVVPSAATLFRAACTAEVAQLAALMV